MLSDSNDGICLVVIISSTLHSLFRKTTPPSKVSMDTDKTPLQSHVHEIDSSRDFIPTSTPSSSFIVIRLNIVEALKVTKSIKKRSNFELIIVDFNNNYIHEVKYLPSSFDNNVLFVLLLVAMGVPSAYEHSMDGINKMCNGHPWCTTKTTNIQNDSGFSFRRSPRVGHLQ